jgi:predicted Zn-dependent peptidase
MFKSKIVSLSLVSLVIFSLNAHAKLYKWVDDQGITHYGEIIPPEYANKDRDSIKKSGGLEKRPEKITPELKQARDEEAQRKKSADQAALEQTRRDSALLNTYSNENEIDQARDRSLVLVNARIESNTMLLKSAQVTLDGHKNEVENRTKAGRKIPQSLTDDIAESEARVAKFKKELHNSEEELIAVKSRFERDKLQYRRLKGIPPTQ